MIPREVSLLARDHLNDNQRQVFMWHLRDGIPLRTIATNLDLARTTVVDRFDAACRILRKHGVRFRETDGLPYMEEAR